MIQEQHLYNGAVKASKVSQTGCMQAGQVPVDASGGTVVLFGSTFASVPKIVAADTGSAAGAIALTTISAGSFTLTSAAAGTVDWIAVVTPTG